MSILTTAAKEPASNPHVDKRTGLPHSVALHALRHTCATLLLRQGVNPRFVQELLGHGDVSLTLNVYSHVLPDMGDAAAGAMDYALG
jgi:integrase